jgi:hypothetical protein
MSHGKVISIAAIWLAGCLAAICGCRQAISPRASQAIYPGGLSFFAKGSGAYQSLEWRVTNANKPEPCQLVLHMPNGDLTALDLADVKKLQVGGWRKSFEDNGGATIEYRWEERENSAEKTLAQVTLVNGALHRVLLRTTEGVAASIHGKRLTLPIAARELNDLLGKPLRVEVTDVFQGKVAR